MQELIDLYKEKYTLKVKQICRILNGDWAAAEDVVQEGFTRALAYKNSYNPDRGSLETWFNKILFNALRDVQNEMRGRPLKDEGISAQDLFGEEDLLKRPYFWRLLKEKISEVKNAKHKQILELFFLMGYRSSEIAEIEWVTQTNVTTVVNRFKKEFLQLE